MSYLKNHQSHPIGSMPFPKANAISSHDFRRGHGQRHRCDRGNGSHNSKHHGSHNSRNTTYH